MRTVEPGNRLLEETKTATNREAFSNQAKKALEMLRLVVDHGDSYIGNNPQLKYA
jgi:aminoglycoside phosphotransferase